MLFDVRHVESTPENQLRFASDNDARLSYHPLLKRLFHRTVFDPSPFLRKGYPRENYCVLGAFLLTCYTRLVGGSLKKVSLKCMEKALASINISGLFNLGERGLKLHNFHRLETQNSNPITPALVKIFPALAYYQGLSFNIYQIRANDHTFRLFPLGLSKFSRNSNYFQIDLIQTTPAILDNKCKTPNSHVLAAPFLATLINKFGSHQRNRGHFTHLCRSCCAVFNSSQSLLCHFETCSIDARRGSAVARLRSRNRFIHLPKKMNRFSNRLEVNCLAWQRSQNFKLIKSLTIAFADLEAYNINLPDEVGSIYTKVPTNAMKTQKAMSYCYCFKSLYPSIPLPTTLASPRVRFCPQTPESSDEDLFLSFFLNLRSDLLEHSKFLHSVLSKDVPPTPAHLRSPRLIAFFKGIKFCFICGKRFGSKSWSNVSKKYYVVRRQYDHDHYSASSSFPMIQSGLRAVLCQVLFTFLLSVFR